MNPLIDPRRGDAEDDLSSPKSRSLLAIAGSLLAEISPAKLGLALASLVVVPSLLLGAAPLVVTGWLETLSGRARADVGIVSLLLLGLVLGLGWLGGRRLFRLAERSFWALNAVAVQPLYALSREVLRHLAERLLARRDDRLRLLRVRAATALVAAVLLALAAIAVALALWPETRWIGHVADLASPLRLVWPTLANTGFVMSAYLAAAALAWGLADATMPQPQGLTEFDPERPGGAAWRVAHLSDLHTVGERYGYRIESGRGGPQGNDRVRAALARLAAVDARHPVDLVLVSGDMTDAGRSPEWAEFLDALEAHPGLLAKTLVLPGNHDVNVVDRANPARLDLPTSPAKLLRALRALSAMAAVQGGRTHVVEGATGRLGPTLESYLHPHRDAIARFADTGGGADRRRLGRLWEEVFPLVLPPGDEGGLGVLIMNTNAQTHFSFTNALGLVTLEQVVRLEAVLRAAPKARWILALHHHLVEYPRPVQALSERIGTVLVNGSWFVRRLQPFADRLVAMHGHRHIDWIGRTGELRVVSAPSPVMTREEARFYVHRLAPGDGARLALLAPECVPVGEGVTAGAGP